MDSQRIKALADFHQTLSNLHFYRSGNQVCVGGLEKLSAPAEVIQTFAKELNERIAPALAEFRLSIESTIEREICPDCPTVDEAIGA